MNTVELTHTEIRTLVSEMGEAIRRKFGIGASKSYRQLAVYGVPRGGIPVMYRLMSFLELRIVENIVEADFIVDDLIDSGRTMERYEANSGKKPFFALIDKRDPDSPYHGNWVIFPWEQEEEKSIEDSIVRLLQFVGEDAGRGGLLETPARVARAWRHWCSGYGKDPASVLKVFEDGADNYDQMVVVKDIPIYSKCEHHLADIFGTATIAYIPNGRIVGLSKLSRLADMFARRLQVQERLTSQIADALVEHLNPVGVGVMVRARHMCMESRGTCQQGHHTVTTALRGAIRDDAQARSEFLDIAGAS